MRILLPDFLRGLVSSLMYMLLLFTLTKTKLEGRRKTILFMALAFATNIGSSFWFYIQADLTGLSRFTILLFILVAILLKPLTKLSIMQWSFTFLTSINIAMMIIALSFYLGRLFPSPEYPHIAIRFLLYVLVIYLFKRFFLNAYQSVVKNWPSFSILMMFIFLNLAYYFFVTDDIKLTLEQNRLPILLLIYLSLAAYGTIFYSLNKLASLYALEQENQMIHEEQGKLQAVALEMEKYAKYDMLTSLPNRRYFFEHLEALVAKQVKETHISAVLFIDLDTFKAINDTYGHDVGDGVLIAVGNRLKGCVRESDFVARLGGDEFAVILHDIEERDHVKNLAQRMHAAIQESIQVDTQVCTVNASIGVAFITESERSSETLLKNADAAMYGIKRKGKGGVCMFGDCQATT
ncbi:MAG: diguanylate cyclase [Spirochaetales bacterium]|nr:diguanylate cyclase [Spirochaetales bacterium]